jgi:hypothetical protein
MESNLDILFLDVETSPSQLEKARAERRLIDAMTDIPWNKKIIITAARLKDTHRNIRARARLLNASPISDGLWHLIESNELTLSSALVKLQGLEDEAGIPRRSVKKKENNEPVEPSKSVELDIFIPEPISPPPSKKLEDKFSVLSEIAILTEKMTELLSKKNPNLQEDSIEFLVREVELDLKRSIEIMKTRANRMEKLGETVPGISNALDRKAMARVYESCDLLGVSRPKKNRPVELGLAKKQMRIRCKPYHPDFNQDDKEAESRFKEIIEAYSILEEYNVNLDGVSVI